jgi:hypothetical protein
VRCGYTIDTVEQPSDHCRRCDVTDLSMVEVNDGPDEFLSEGSIAFLVEYVAT